jgi:hypothetical protein
MRVGGTERGNSRPSRANGRSRRRHDDGDLSVTNARRPRKRVRSNRPAITARRMRSASARKPSSLKAAIRSRLDGLPETGRSSHARRCIHQSEDPAARRRARRAMAARPRPRWPPLAVLGQARTDRRDRSATTTRRSRRLSSGRATPATSSPPSSDAASSIRQIPPLETPCSRLAGPRSELRLGYAEASENAVFYGVFQERT